MQEAPAGSMDSSPFRSSGHGTLDEPVMETFMRDVRSIGEKLKFVLVPRKTEDHSKALREWDLWGPLLLCLAMSIILSLQSKGSDQAGQVFALVFVLVWIGSAVVTANAVLLKGKISFFQSVCVLGYCLFPLVIAAFICALIPIQIIRILIVVGGFTWSTGASVGFTADLVPEDRRALATYPVWLFYVAISWIILLA